jgi:hypothetical protein
MRAVRFPIAGLMGAVLVVALGLAALRNASETWAGVMFLLTCGVLSLAIVGVICREDGERAWWLGFALFGWGYLLLSLWSTVTLPTMALLDVIATRLGIPLQFSGGMGGGMRNVGLWAFGGFGGGFGGMADHPLQEIAHCLWALVAALLGGFLARALFGGSTERAENLAAPPQAAIQTSRGWWVWPAVLGLAGGVFIVFLSLIGSRSSPGFWVGATFLATCALLGITILGAVGDHGRRRHLWLGAAIFGVSYMAMAFGRSLDRETWPSLPTDHFLQVLRPWFPPVVSGFPTSSDGVAAANARIWETLDRPIPMRFLDDTPLEDVLKYVRGATIGQSGKGISIYIDPIGLQEAEKSMTSTIRNIDLDDVPLKTSLRLCLDQLDMTYRIRDGMLFITSKESEVTPVYQDPFLIVGHCVLALLAAAFGAIVAPFFSDVRRASRTAGR